MKIILDVSVVEKRNRVSVVLITVNCFCQKETRFLNLKKKPGFCGGEKKPGFSWRKETGFLVEKRNRVFRGEKKPGFCGGNYG